jgi:hypothetical protein
LWSTRRSNSITSQGPLNERENQQRPFSNGDTIKYRGDNDDIDVEPRKTDLDASSDQRFLATSPRLLSPPNDESGTSPRTG